eukprot:CCRYP_001635-RA/>CCRYP_001635-RA protein AED:0.24 eAED:0.24 QI:106/1/0.5/1/0/0/2/0/64
MNRPLFHRMVWYRTSWVPVSSTENEHDTIQCLKYTITYDAGKIELCIESLLLAARSTYRVLTAV